MAEAHEKAKRIYRNLLDAGCDDSLISTCMELLKAGKCDEMLAVLARHRKTLLDAVHREQKQIDCLDFLIYKIQKEKVILL